MINLDKLSNWLHARHGLDVWAIGFDGRIALGGHVDSELVKAIELEFGPVKWELSRPYEDEKPHLILEVG